MKWITREKIKVDRVACPWLIKKFVDPDADFVFLPHDTDWTKISDGIVFDVPDCELGHHGEDVSFNSILKKYKLTDPALVLLGEIVRAADSHPANPHPAGEGLRWVAGGFGALGLSDHEILEREFIVYDALYAECKRRVSRGLVARSRLAAFSGSNAIWSSCSSQFLSSAQAKSFGCVLCRSICKRSARRFLLSAFTMRCALAWRDLRVPRRTIADRWGHRHAFMIFNVVSIVGYALVLLIPNWGASDRWNVFLSFMDLFFVAGDVFANRGCARSKPPLHGRGRSIGDQTIADHDRANLRRDVDRSLRNHPRRANRAPRLDLLSASRFLCSANCAKTPLMNRKSPRQPRPEAERWSLWQSLRDSIRRCDVYC